MITRARQRQPRGRLAPWLVAIVTVYTLTVAAWFAAIDWSGDRPWETGAGPKLVSATRTGPPQ